MLNGYAEGNGDCVDIYSGVRMLFARNSSTFEPMEKRTVNGMATLALMSALEQTDTY